MQLCRDHTHFLFIDGFSALNNDAGTLTKCQNNFMIRGKYSLLIKSAR